ncbi:type II toxin-antitoxin system RelB/DinJ family antitoxin [Bifidobacterium avesanii]|uniref:Type II toxin-antitoxin system RelB/DinJ family antitoxin n=1 Tax=Bifidobacterium avesanii TaxID=1798157 RepID=A0A7K3TEG1_9BIFI|nr:type II toxin-antitoxin system RelB/DinJ family antitoxin [Bifidobacterium avesanii]KAB8295416.1 addiction module antitoxin, RelB/DinJ family [Bifidobacterium avesanii]NEG77422.1 hypothetical protein [Bifidobacterium avesanii]
MTGTKERTTLTLDAKTKEEAAAILDELGMSLSTFVDVSLKQLVRNQGMPFRPTLEVRAPRRLSREEVLREVARLDALTPPDVQAGLAALTPDDERRLLEERDA